MRKTTFFWVMIFGFIGTLFAQTPIEMSEIQEARLAEGQGINIQELLDRREAVGSSTLPMSEYFNTEEIAALSSYYKSQNRNILADFTPTAGATETFAVAPGDFFFDTGGPGGGGLNAGGGPGTELPGNYLNCDCVTTTTLEGATEIEFTEFEVFGNFDFLIVYDGTDASGPVLYDSNTNATTDTFAGMVALNGSGVFTGTSGDITFVFDASGVVDHTGWEVEILSAGGGGGGSNEWSVLVEDLSGNFGDEVTWELRDNTSAVILSGGPYVTNYSDFQTVTTSNEPLEFFITAVGFFGDNTPNYTVSCSGAVVVSGSLFGGDTATESGLLCGSTPPPPPAAESIAYGYEAFALNMYGNFDTANPGVFNSVSTGGPTTGFEPAGDIDPTNNSTAYVNDADAVGGLGYYSVDIATGVYTLIGPSSQSYNGFSFNPVDGLLYAVDGLNLYSVDKATGVGTLIGPFGIGAGELIIDIAIDGNGDAYVHDVVTDSIYTVDLTTGTATLLGATGFDANFAQGMTWDPNTDTVYLAAFNNTAFLGQLRSVNTATGATTVVGVFNGGATAEVTWMAVQALLLNDECSGAIAMECGDTETGDTTTNTDTGGANASPDAWYSFTGSGTAELVTFSLCDGGTGYDSLLTVFDACGGAVVAANDDSCGLQSEVSFLSDGTTTYYVAVEGFGTSAGAFSLAVTCNPVAENDLCDDAIDISCGETVLGSTEFATPDAGSPDCGAGNNSPGVWYVIDDTSGLVTDYTVSLCDGGTTYDSKLVVYSGDCGTLVCVAENDDSCGLQSEVSFQGDGSSTYYILVNGFGTGSSGDFSLNLSCTPVPPFNDMIVNSIDVDEAGLPYTDPSVPMPAATTEAGGTPANCDNAGVLGVWYNFVPENNGTATATVVSPAGYTSVTFYTAPNEEAVETDLTLVDWFDNQCVPGVTTSIPVVAGQAYYVYVANHEGVTDIVIDGDFFLGVGDAVVDGFTYFPNPANNELNLDAGARSIDSAAIYNILGQTVVEQQVGASSTRLDVAALSVGTYILKVVVEGEVGIYKIVKQ